jgi:hypothetical protein
VIDEVNGEITFTSDPQGVTDYNATPPLELNTGAAGWRVPADN